ncbi:MAG TPA: ATP-binding protein, partial [Caldimonas sp.]|nr:ATP-binding protein [Caldimonas sp.]
HEERARAERLSEQLRQGQKLESIGRLAGGVAHDFNNLLTVIRGNTDVLARRVKGQAQAEPSIVAIRAATERAAKLTRQLLVFARGGPAEPVPVDLTRKVLDLLGAMSQLVGVGVAIETDFEPGLPAVSVDPLQLEAALLNLAANARDAMDGSGMLYLRLRRSGDWVALQVRDAGPGFDPQVLPRVFDPFFTTKPVGKGTGLGLSQVYGLVKGAGGRVEAANAPGGGAVVTLSFPPAAAAASAPEAEAQPASPPAAGSGAATVLLVDDNEAMLTRASGALAGQCEVVGSVTDGESVLEAAGILQPDVIVLDISMRGMSGLEVARILRSRDCRAAIVFLTVHEEDEVVLAARAAGALGYVIKARLGTDLAGAVLDASVGRAFVSASTFRAPAGTRRGRPSPTPSGR